MIGDANVDMEIRLPQMAAPTHANPDPRLFGGGSAANTAAALARLDVDCRFVGAIGDDDFGRFATQSLADSGVDVRSVTTVAGSPTVMVMVVIPDGGDRLIYVWPPTGGAHGALTVDHALASSIDADWLHVSGLCLRLAPARDAVLAAMEQANEAGIPVSFDLNLRLENWGWDDGFRQFIETAVARADVVLGAAEDEIVPLANHDDVVEAGLSIAADRRTVIARLGADGSVACSADGVVAVPSFPVEVIDTVGAGDAFNAGFIAARLKGADLTSALRQGNAVAALSVAQPGARSTPARAQVDTFLSRR